MLGTTDLALFIAAGLALNVAPGPDTLYIVGRSAAQGWRGGALAALGIGAGLCVHTVAAAIGVSALLAASATAFTVLKWAGAAYLVYVGIRLAMSTPATISQTRFSRGGEARMIFVQGFLTNVLNPKVALFFLAFLPQFVDLEAPNRIVALLFLGFVFNVNGTLWNLLVAWSASRFASRVGSSKRLTVWLNRTVGAFFVYLGVRLVTSHGD